MGRECEKFYLHLAQVNLKKENFRNRFQVIRFEQKFAGGREQDAEKQRNLKSTLMYLILLPKYELDDNRKTNIDIFESFFRNLQADDCSGI